MAARSVEPLELRAAAAALGIHYQTAYRWVRTGHLPARLASGRYVVHPSDIDAVKTARATDARPSKPGKQRLTTQARRMGTALRNGDEATARQISHTLVGEGTTIADLIQHVFVPGLRDLGQDWYDGTLTIWVEHRATGIVERILGGLAPHPRGRRRGMAMVAAVSGDHHSLPTTMAAVTLRDDNWHVQHLGADMPSAELIRFCSEHDVTIAVITLTNPECSQLAETTAIELRTAGTPTIVGGPGRTLRELVEAARAAKLANSMTP
jgi:MerR family transcriptional regulator, light-induced transcriptional regulator